MGNERITEELVRDHFKNDPSFNVIKLEEQKSANLRIEKLLKHASKSGDGSGKPEFILSYKNNSDFLIVIECKADIKKHESRNIDKPKEHAVDGALLYSSYLSKEFDVLAIGVSGQKQEEIKVSHYLQLKNSNFESIFGDTLLSINDYLGGYLKNDKKFRQDYSNLLNYSIQLNGELHAKKIKESQRSLLISGILIALESQGFKRSYRDYKSKDLSENLVNTISQQLVKASLQKDKIENLKLAFSFIKLENSLAHKEGTLLNLIKDVDDNINQFIQTHKYFDILGQFYIEFLRFANSDKSLGIVLTPPHITELFVELTQINKDSTVLDNCTGTSGFLISAMKKMIKDCHGDERKEKNIKQNQLIGIEYQTEIYALAISNMFIHGDGKSNIFHGDCFEIQDKISNKFRCTVGLLNPPYKTEKTDKEEFEFILNNLEMLEKNGTCIAIIPMSCVLATKGEGLELKKRLLNNHTLEGVLSMPDELFFNSKVGVVTATLIIKAHVPHSFSKQTWFGYCKDDGFVKRKIEKRINYYSKWDKIKKEWVSSFLNKKTKPGFSVMKIITPTDEWCAEAYMETDYSKLTEIDFINTIKNYTAYQFLSN